MKIVNRDMTRENIKVFVSNNQIYVRIFFHSHGKWQVGEYFQAYDWKVDRELIASTLRYITRTWNLKSPKVVIE